MQSEKRKKRIGIVIVLVLLVPLLLILSRIFGLTGVIWATPITDAGSFIIALSFLIWELKHMPKTDDPVTAPVTESSE